MTKLRLNPRTPKPLPDLGAFDSIFNPRPLEERIERDYPSELDLLEYGELQKKKEEISKGQLPFELNTEPKTRRLFKVQTYSGNGKGYSTVVWMHVMPKHSFDSNMDLMDGVGRVSETIEEAVLYHKSLVKYIEKELR